jgi:hypothetical protein
VLPQVPNVVFAGKIPEDFMEHRFEVDSLGCQKREALLQIYDVMLRKAGDGVNSCTVFLVGSVGKDTLDKIEIFTHRSDVKV